MSTCVLVVDDDAQIRKAHERVLSRAGYEVRTAVDGQVALELVDGEPVDLIVTDLEMPEVDGLELIARLRDSGRETPVVVVTGQGTIGSAMEAVRLGATDFLEKPLLPDRLLVTVENAMRYQRLRNEHARLVDVHSPQPRLLGDSRPMDRLRSLIAKVAPTDGRVLIEGESGTGKELVAEAIHQASRRAEGPFVKLNSAAVPAELVESELFGHEKGAFTGATSVRRGRFELADGGTIFLDEIGDMQPPMQAKLLRVLQEHQLERVGGSRTIEVDVRVLAATNQDLAAKVDEGSFREDLYYRLNVVHVTMPPLRERREDIQVLTRHFLDRLAMRGHRRIDIEDDAVEALMTHDYPGNVRELQNLVERLAILCDDDVIRREDVAQQLPSLRTSGEGWTGKLFRPGVTLRDQMHALERRVVMEAIEANGGNKSAAARELQVERSHFFKKLHTLGLAGD
jgi:DNA-binding NtrC family response regulator